MDKDEIKVPEEFINALRAVYSDSAAHYCDIDKHAKMLYEAALKCAKEEINYPFHLDNSDINKEFEYYRDWVHANNLSPTLAMTAHHFANWQKKQMMKDAVETIVYDDWQYGEDPDKTHQPAIKLKDSNFKIGDKVKVLFLKDDDNK